MADECFEICGYYESSRCETAEGIGCWPMYYTEDEFSSLKSAFRFLFKKQQETDWIFVDLTQYTTDPTHYIVYNLENLSKEFQIIIKEIEEEHRQMKICRNKTKSQNKPQGKKKRF